MFINILNRAAVIEEILSSYKKQWKHKVIFKKLNYTVFKLRNIGAHFERCMSQAKNLKVLHKSTSQLADFFTLQY